MKLLKFLPSRSYLIGSIFLSRTVFMFDPSHYELIDFGDGRKLERFGNRLVRRETPSVPLDGRKIKVADVPSTDFFRRGHRGRWSVLVDDNWKVDHRGVTFNLKTTPTGQVGLFPEQATNWDWLLDCGVDLSGLNAINLFGYTGGTTLALASAGASVTHIDSAKTIVSWARKNAESSGLAGCPIRWIVEDASKFVDREVKRKKCYEIIIADPPSFGRGLGKEIWKLERDLPKLLSTAAQLSGDRAKMVIVSCHTPGYDAQKLSQMVSKAWRIPLSDVEGKQMSIRTGSGRSLHAGEVARWLAR